MGGWGDAIKGGVGGAAAGAKAGPWGALIGGGIGALTGGLSSKSPAELAQDAIYKNVPSLIQKGNAATDSGLERLNQAGNFYSTVLGGNKEQINNLLSPEVSTVLSQYDNAANTVKQFAPRGGGSTSQIAATPFQKAAAYGNAYQGVLPGAASGATAVGSALSGTGTNLTGLANGVGPTALGKDTLTSGLESSAGRGLGQTSASGGLEGYIKAGKGLGGLLAKILTKKGSSNGDFGDPGGSFDVGSFGDPEA